MGRKNGLLIHELNGKDPLVWMAANYAQSRSALRPWRVGGYSEPRLMGQGAEPVRRFRRDRAYTATASVAM